MNGLGSRPLGQHKGDDHARQWMGDLALGLACLAPPLIARAVLLAEAPAPVEAADLRGVLADLVAAAACWLVLAALARVARPLALLVALVWALLHYANLEHINALGVMLNSENAHLMTATFVRGSVLAITRPGLLALLLLAGLLPSAAALYIMKGRRQLLLPLGVGIVMGGALLFVPMAEQVSAWRQDAPIWGEIAEIGREPVDTQAQAPRVRLPEVQALTEVKLRGPRWLDSTGERDNVLLIVLESISGAMVDNVAAAHHLSPSGLMPQLSAISAQHLSWTKFILEERMTNRGEYTLLCGDHPKLLGGTAKMTAVAFGAARRCLPRLLARAGYATVYAQAAPLSFMFKDRFMPRAGFQRMLGDSYFSHGRVSNQWGVDDVSFFEQVVPLVAKLAKGAKPYFLTLMTVGTHHPYLIPDDFAASAAAKGLQRKHVAVRWADRGLGRFVAALRSRQLLRNTLVLITSDESMGAPQALPDGLRQLSDNWGLLVAIPPRVHDPKLVTSWSANSDVAISILDYLGLTQDRGTLLGHSLFRRPSPHTLVFGNVYRKRIQAIRPDGTLHQCDQSFQHCEVFRIATGGLFSGPLVAVEGGQPAISLLRGAARLGLDLASQAEPSAKIPLVQREELPLHTDGRINMLIGGQFFEVAAGTRVQAVLDFQIAGEGASVSPTAVLTDHATPLARFDLPLMSAGDQLRLNLLHVPARHIGQLQLFFYAMVKAGAAARVRFTQATLELSAKRPDGAPWQTFSEPRLLLSPKRMRIKPRVHTFRLGDPRHFTTFACAEKTPRGVVVTPSCGFGKPAIAGPDVTLLGRRTLLASTSIRGQRGVARIRLVLLVKRAGKRVELANENIVVKAGRQAKLVVRATLDGFSTKVQAQLYCEAKGKPSAARALIEKLELRIAPVAERGR